MIADKFFHRSTRMWCENYHTNHTKTILTKFLTGGRQMTRSTSLVGRDKPVAFEPKIFVLDRGHRTWSDRVTRLTAQLM